MGDGNGDTFTANGGNDIILAGGGTDTVYGGNGDDIIVGGSGSDTLFHLRPFSGDLGAWRRVASAFHQRTLGKGRREQLHAVVVDREQRCEVRRVRILDQFGSPIVEDQPVLVETRGQHGMILPDGAVADQHQSQI